MYVELEKQYSKKRYSQILDETQRIAEYELSLSMQEEDSDIWISIISQIKDIREKIVEKQILFDWEEIYNRYSLGSLGIEFFNDEDEIHMRLCDIFHGAVHYNELESSSK